MKIEDDFCIDSTEVTNEQYLAFVEAASTLTYEQPPECAWNSVVDGNAFEPSGEWYPDTAPDYPVAYVDWCDARAYCEWAGKRLCGRIGGLPGQFDDFADIDAELYYACSHGGEQTYATGDQPPDACGTNVVQVQAVKSYPGCEGGYPGIFDLVGNVQEWVAYCQQPTDGTEFCHLGPGQSADVNTQRCDYGDSYARNVSSPFIGIRCCSDVVE